MNAKIAIALVILGIFDVSTAAALSEPPAAVSPGFPDRFSMIEDRCPTFSWGQVEGAHFYELVVYSVPAVQTEPANPPAGPSEVPIVPEPLLKNRLPGTATTWTPGLESCFEYSGRYAWSVRAVDAEVDSPWSEARLFQISHVPSPAQAAEALALLRRYVEGDGAVDVVFDSLLSELPNEPLTGSVSEETFTETPMLPNGQSLALSGSAAIRGAMPDASGEVYGVLGVTASAEGAGLAAENKAGGPDLLLDGSPPTAVTEQGIDRSDGSDTSFEFKNTGGGSMTLNVDGVAVVTTATDQDSLGGLSCANGELAKRNSGQWGCEEDLDTTYTAGNHLVLEDTIFHVTDGSGSGLDADTLDGQEANTFSATSHGHYGASWSGASTSVPALTITDSGSTGRGISVQAGFHAVDAYATGAFSYGVSGWGGKVGVEGRCTDNASEDCNGVTGWSDSSSTGASWGVSGKGFSDGGGGVTGICSNPNGAGVGVKGESDSSGPGVLGLQTAMTGTQVGVYGESYADGGRGMEGHATATSGATYGLFGRSVSPSGTGMWGFASSSSGLTYGVYGVSHSSAGTGVAGFGGTVGIYGETGNSTGATYGVYAKTRSPDGYGVYAFATADGANQGADAIFGRSEGPTGRGVVGWVTDDGLPDYTTSTGVYGRTDSITGVGVHGRSTFDSSLSTAVWGDAFGGSAWAGDFSGNVRVVGTLVKTAGAFQIDHPLKPEAMYLNHSFVESPDMMNLYNGNVTLDEKGEAWVELPEWFEALNRDFRYQLTPLGRYVALWIAEEIAGNRFKIAGSVGGARVSWLVTGIRQDPWAEAHRIPVEENKRPEEVGTYLHPEVYGQPAEFDLYYKRREATRLRDEAFDKSPPEPRDPGLLEGGTSRD